jgi:MFS family permease
MGTAAQILRSRPDVFYGWWVVAGVFAVLFMGFGAAYTFGSFFHSLHDEFGASRREVSLVFSLTAFLYFALGAVSGPLADCLGPRRVIAVGGLLIGAGLLLAAMTENLWQVYLTYSLGVGLGVGVVYVPSVSVVQRWFVRQRGFASGLAVAGIGLGTLVLPPIATQLVAAFGWRWAYALLGVSALAVMIPAALLIEQTPAARGLTPDGDPPSSGGAAAAVSGAALREALQSATFWWLYVALLMTSLGLFMPFVHLVPYATDNGVSAFTASLILGMIGAGSTFGRLALGGVADRLGRRQSLAGAFLLMACMLVWWLMSTSVWALLLFATLFGLGYGGIVALLPALTTDYFGVRQAGAIIGWLYTSAAIGSLLGPTLAGIAFDWYHSYALPILLSAGANLVAFACMVVLGKTVPKHY